MRTTVFVICCVLCFAGSARADSALRLMGGAWRGDGHYILIDAERMQANDDPDKPFQRDPLVIQDISGRMVTFSIRQNRYFGLFSSGELRLTGGRLEGAAILRR